MEDGFCTQDFKHHKMKRMKLQEQQRQQSQTPDGFLSFDENLLFEVLKHADGQTLGMAACVSKLWHETIQDERLWEIACTRQWANIGWGNKQLRSVVLALGGFRRLHSQYLWPLSSSKQSARMMIGKDAVNVSLSLLSIKYYEKMNFSKRGL